MKKYLVPLLVLVLLLVSVTTVFADKYWTRFNVHGVCTFIQQPENECNTDFTFDSTARLPIWALGCASDFNINLKQKGKLSPYIPDWDSEWKCQAEGAYHPGNCGFYPCDEIRFGEILLLEEITP